MLSVVIETRNDEDGLARTLASLVAGAVDGMVREVIVCDGGSTDRTHFVADHAGCRYLATGGVAAGIRQARSEWLMLLEPGARLCDGWIEQVAAHTASSTAAARFRAPTNSGGGLFRRVFSARRPLANGLVITKRQATALARKSNDGSAIARGLSARKLPAEIVAATS